MFDWTDFCQTAKPVSCCTTHWHRLNVLCKPLQKIPRGFKSTLKEAQWKLVQTGNATLVCLNQLVPRFLLFSFLMEEKDKPSSFATIHHVVKALIHCLIVPYSHHTMLLCSSLFRWIVRISWTVLDCLQFNLLTSIHMAAHAFPLNVQPRVSCLWWL